MFGLQKNNLKVDYTLVTFNKGNILMGNI